MLGLGAAAAGAVIAGRKMINLASDAAEVQSKMEVTFGRELPKLTKNLDEFSKATGASRYELREQTADMGALLVPLVGSKKAGADLSEQFVKLATDLSSFNNVPVDDALLAIRSGLVGEAEPLRRFGVLLNEAAVKQEGLRLGLVKGKEEMTEQQKVMARASLIMKQTTLAQGDAERTSGSMANQMRRLQNEIRDAATEMGQKLIPFALAAVRAFNDNWPAISKVVDQVMTLMVQGVTMAVTSIRSNFTQIKAVVTTAFEGAVTAGRKLVAFFQTDFGQTIGLGVGALLTLKAAMGALGISIGGIGKALTLLKGNPMWALLIPLGYVVGSIAQQFIQAKIEAANLDAALRRAAGGADALKTSMDALKDANLGVKEASLGVKQAQANAQQQQQRYNALVRAGKKDTEEGRQADLDRKAAWTALARANLTLEQAQKRQTDAQKAHTSEVAKGQVELFRARDLIGKLSDSKVRDVSVMRMQQQEAAKFSQKAKDVAKGATEQALAFAKSDPAASRAAAKVALLATKAGDLALKLKKVPSKSDIKAEAKAVNFDKFYAELLKVGRKTKETAKTAADGGRQTGSALGEGIYSGMGAWINAIVARAQFMVTAAVAAAHAAAGKPKSPAPATVPIGKSLSEGLAYGILVGAPGVETAARDRVKNALGTMASTLQTIGTTLGQSMRPIAKELADRLGDAKNAIDQAQLAEKMQRQLERLSAAVEAQKARLMAAFGRLSDDALKAFDARTDAGLAKIQSKLDAKLKQIADKLAKGMARIDVAQAAQTPAEKALAQLDRSETVRGLQQGIADAQKAMQDALAEEDPTRRLEAIQAAEEQMRQAQLAIRRDSLQQQAAQERAAADAQAEAQRAKLRAQADREQRAAEKRAAQDAKNYQANRDLMRRNLELFLQAQQEYLDEHPKRWRRVHERVMKAFKDEFGPDMQTAGRNLGAAFIEGMNQNEAGMESAAAKLARLIAKYLKLKSPAEEGPLSDIDTWWSGMGQMLADQIDLNPIKAKVGLVGKVLRGDLGPSAEWAGGKIVKGLVGPTKTATTALDDFGTKKDETIDNLGKLQTTAETTKPKIEQGIILPLLSVKDAAAQTTKQVNGLIGTILALDGMTAQAYIKLTVTKDGDFNFDPGSLDVPAMQHGGIVRRATLAMIGEAGPEAVVPLGGSNALTAAVPIVINLDGKKFAETMTQHQFVMARRGDPRL